MLKDFKTFLLRGNVVDLAVAVVVGAAFGAVVTALVRDILTPIIAVIFGKPDFSALSFTINGSDFRYGDFLNFLIAFLSVAAAVFFFVVQPINALMARRKTAARRRVARRAMPGVLERHPAPGPQVCVLRVSPAGRRRRHWLSADRGARRSGRAPARLGEERRALAVFSSRSQYRLLRRQGSGVIRCVLLFRRPSPRSRPRCCWRRAAAALRRRPPLRRCGRQRQRRHRRLDLVSRCMRLR